MSRTKSAGLALACLIGGLAAATPAGAFDAYESFWRCRGAQGYCDPYAYRYRQPGYYPYYNSGYWPPAWAYRRPQYGFEPPRYGKAWGYPRRARPRYSRHHTRRDHSGGW